MRTSESIALAYFVALGVIAAVRPMPAGRRRPIIAILIATSIAIYGLGCATSGVRDWLPPMIIVVAYYLSGAFVVTPSPSIEAWLSGWDRRLLGDAVNTFRAWPPWSLAALDLLYLSTPLTVPAGFAAMWLAGESARADYYWTIVMGTLLICYAGTALIHTRPPRTLERTLNPVRRSVRRFGSQAVDTLTIGINTIPSGHVAAPLAVGLALIDSRPVAGAAFVLMAGGVALTCIAGRYHFVVDCVLGAIVAIALFLIVG